MEKITVTTPLLPPLAELTPYLEDIWQRKWLTNNGHYHQQLEKELCEYLGVKYISLFSNGTLALITALQALEIEGEVITTPYSFVATSHSIMLNGSVPVFVDVEPQTYNLDPAKIEAAITDKTTAIMPVHVYGNPCAHEEIKRIADKHNLKIIYDAAHAFGVKKNGESVLNWGDLSILSFHATKAYSTIEGGAVISHTAEMKHKLDKLKNFGYDSEVEISMLGTNAKMNEVQAAFGLATLKHIDAAIEKRKIVAEKYRRRIDEISGVSYITCENDILSNNSYFPILINKDEYGTSRDELYQLLKENNILSRRYFYPLITDFELYKKNDTINKNGLDIAKLVSDNVICLPMHHELNDNEIDLIMNIIETQLK